MTKLSTVSLNQPSTAQQALETMATKLTTESKPQNYVDSNSSSPSSFARRFLSSLTLLSNSITDQVRADKDNGTSGLSAANEFAALVTQAFSHIAGIAQNDPGVGGIPTLFDQLGRAAQQHLIEDLRQEALSAGLEQPTAPTSGTVTRAVGAAYSAYQLFGKWGQTNPITGAIQGGVAGAYLGSQIVPGVGTAIGGAVGGVIGFIGGLFKTGKHKDQLARDQMRDVLRNIGMINERYEITLANGVKYNIGKDGGFRLNSVDGTTRRAYEVDFGHPFASEVVAMVNPLAAMITGGDPKLTSDLAGYFTNAVLSNARTIEEAQENVLAIKSGVGDPNLRALL